MSKISTNDIVNQNRRQTVGGLRDPKIKITELPKTVQSRQKESNIDDDEFEEMLYFAKKQPRGKRELNAEDLSYLIISSEAPPLTDHTGLRGGGEVAKTVTQGNIKSLKRRIPTINIKNANRLKVDNGFTRTNPNFTSFKNNFNL